MYKLQLDQVKDFQCKLKIEGASLKKSKANLIIESDTFDLKFKGKINQDGQVTIPLNKLKGILDENIKGNMYLEVIADDMYFTPYSTEYITETSRKVEVISVNDENILVEDSAPKITVTDVQESTPAKPKKSIKDNPQYHSAKLIKIIKEHKLNIFKLEDKTKIANQIQKYLKSNKINEELTAAILKEMCNFVQKIIM